VSEIRTVSPRQTRLAVAAFVGTLVGGVIMAGAISLANNDLQTEIEAKTQILEGLKQRAVADVTGRGRTGELMIEEAAIAAPTETVAASTLQKYVMDRLEGAGGAVLSVQSEPGREAGPEGLRQLTAQLSFDSSIGSLQRLLFDLETGAPFVFVNSLAAQPATTTTPGTRMGDRLRVTLLVWSYWKSDAPGRGDQ
jgi:general secretion pathway protein M